MVVHRWHCTGDNDGCLSVGDSSKTKDSQTPMAMVPAITQMPSVRFLKHDTEVMGGNNADDDDDGDGYVDVFEDLANADGVWIQLMLKYRRISQERWLCQFWI